MERGVEEDGAQVLGVEGEGDVLLGASWGFSEGKGMGEGGVGENLEVGRQASLAPRKISWGVGVSGVVEGLGRRI